MLRDYLRDPSSVIEHVLGRVRDLAIELAPTVGIALAALIVVLALAWSWRRRRREQRLADGARVVTILPPPTVDPAGAVTVWSNLVGLLRPAWRRLLSGQPHVSFEYIFSEDGVRLQVWVPGGIPPGMVERAVESAWPGAHTKTTKSVPPIPAIAPAGQRILSAGGQLRLARTEALPLRSAFPTDPIRALLGAPTGLRGGQRAVVQVVARPVTGRRLQRARRAAKRLHAGHSPHFVGSLLDLLTPRPVTSGRTQRRTASTKSVDHQTSVEYAAQDRAIVAKQTGSQYETVIQYAVTTTVEITADRSTITEVRDELRGRAHAIASAFAVYGEHNYYRRHRLRRPVRVIAERRLRRGDLLSVPELAAIAHLPTDETVPDLQRAGAKAVPPPPGIATSGPDVKPIGLSDSGHVRPVGLRIEGSRHHTHIVGATGSGKSELIARQILADADAGRGLVVIDPKGDLVTDVLMRLPERLGGKVVLFDSDSRARPPVLNPLEGPNPHRTVDNLVSIFSRVYADSWGPRTDDILRSGLLTLRAASDVPTLTDLPRLLTSPAFRERLVARIDDEILAGFWTWYDGLSEPARAHAIAPLMNKLRGVLLRPFVRAAIAGGASTVDMDAVLDGGICLVRVAKDGLGAETASLVGSMVLARVWQATLGRARVPQSKRRDAGLYLDEAHNFLNLPYALEDMLAEARAYRLAITLAHQYLDQLPRDLAEGISTNARNKIYFNASPEDARHLARHTLPRLSEHDLSHLGAFHAAVRLVHQAEEAPPCTVITEKLPPAIPGRARKIRAAARTHNGRAASAPTNRPHPDETASTPVADPRRAA